MEAKEEEGGKHHISIAGLGQELEVKIEIKGQSTHLDFPFSLFIHSFT